MASATTAFLDEQGRPLLRESFAAFLDVLGFSHTVVSAAESKQSEQCLEAISRALGAARTFVRDSLSSDELANPEKWAVKFFSDNLLLGYPSDTGDTFAVARFVLKCAQRYQLQMTLSGFFVRGAITLGALCVTDDIIYGTALIESYRLESNAAIVPRVIVTDPVLKAARLDKQAKADTILPDEHDLLCRDIDGWWFINYLQSAVGPAGVNWRQIEEHKQAVLTSLSRSARHDILPKFGWVSRYHNVFCHWHRNDPGYQDEFRIQRVDENSAIERMNIGKEK